MKVIAFAPSYNAKHAKLLSAFVSSIPGASVEPLGHYVPCDIAVIFGYAKDSYPATWAKYEILDKHKGRRLIMLESGFVRRGKYWQVGLGGTAGLADFRSDDMPMDRWNLFGVKTHPWTMNTTGPVVVCGQVPWDTQVQDVDHKAWCRDTIKTLQDAGKEVWFRPHPRIAKAEEYGVTGVHVDLQHIKHIRKTVSAAVTWNSTSAVDFALMGIPVVACDEGSIARPIAGHSIQTLLNGKIPHRSRKKWLAGLGYSQWSMSEMEDGMPWRHLTR